jgi:hypothetical protein
MARWAEAHERKRLRAEATARENAAKHLAGLRVIAEGQVTRWREQWAAKELRRQQAAYRKERQALEAAAQEAIEAPRQARARRTAFSYLMAAEQQHQDNLLRIVGQQFNRLLEEVAPFEEGCSLDEAISPESDYWGARFELQTEGQRDKRQYNRFHGSGPKWGTRQSVA